jgi:outer membrane protein OmpA-like peptidoglycan-associated protein
VFVRSFRSWISAGALLALAACATPQPELAETPPTPLQTATGRVVDAVLEAGLESRGAARHQPLRILPVADELAGAESQVVRGLQGWIEARVRRLYPAYRVVPAVGQIPAGDAASDQETFRAPFELRVVLKPLAAGSAQPLAVEAVLHDPPRGAVMASARQAFSDPQVLSAHDAWRAARAPRPAPSPPPEQAPAEQLAALQADYLSLLRDGHDERAQAVFGRLLALGLASRDLNLRLLFATGSTAFWPDPMLRKRYASWLRELATQMKASTACLEIVGHASRSGNAAYNRKLSQRRAESVRSILLGHEPSLADRLTVRAVGDTDTVVGSDADNAANAADRRVEFAVVDCR